MSEAAGSLTPDFDSLAPFGELGIDSFRVLKIIKKLEADFGRLPKSLLFERFNISDLANYFVTEHQETLAVRFAERLQGSGPAESAPSRSSESAQVPVLAAQPVPRPVTMVAGPVFPAGAPILILEKDAYAHPELKDLVASLFARFKMEGSVSRGTRKIAPNLFIGSARRGFFNYGRSNGILLVYGYTGPREYLPELLTEIAQHCVARGLQLNVLADEPIPDAGKIAFSATPFGALQRIVNLKEFTLDGGAMRRLRYQVTKFQKSGHCRTEEYRCGTDRSTDENIVSVIDRWSGARSMVNPLVYDVRAEILAGSLAPEHRLFLTYLDDVLQNVILISALSAEDNGYLMDLEFYPPEMPMGGLEFAISRIVDVLIAEGCDVLSLGGTYGCKLEPSPTADPEIDKILDDLRDQNIFNDAGNLQFKNKFRPENRSILLCRPVGSSNPENVIDIIMMIADPDRMQTSDAENHTAQAASPVIEAPVQPPTAPALEIAAVRTPSPATETAGADRLSIDGEERSRVLAEFGFNPLNLPHAHVELDLKTDSWAQLKMPAIDAQMRHLHRQLQQPVSVDDALRAVFPFAHFVLTASGQAAEHIFFEAWPAKGIVPQNLLFPSTIFHQIDKGFTPRELPAAEVFRLDSLHQYSGNMSLEALRAEVALHPAAIAMVCIDVANNAAGGRPVSLEHLQSVRALLAEHSIPLVIDATRVVENAQFLIEQEKEHAGKSVWAVVREILSCGDAVIGSLTKDFCVNKGGIIATNDAKLYQRLQELVQTEGAGIDLLDRKMIALSLQNRKHLEVAVLRRMEGVRRLARALEAHNVPIVQPAGGHCVLIDVKQIAEFKGFRDPVASFLAWLYLNTGIRAGAHSVGMQKQTTINDLVRLAVPVGLKLDQIEVVIERLVQAFARKANIPELVMASSAPQPLGGVYANYRLIAYHNVSGGIVEAAGGAPPAPRPVAAPPVSEPAVPETPLAAASAHAQATPAPHKNQDVAIVGMSGRYPKAKNLRELWSNLAQGRDCIDDMPAERHERR
ncbi:MAG TPA: beta-eliminating lyase-related protein, partial [Thermoanaerobaculia bacterium]